MSSGEMNCLARCCDRYVDATKVVSGTIISVGDQNSRAGGLS
jgi:hypothetical protein